MTKTESVDWKELNRRFDFVSGRSSTGLQVFTRGEHDELEEAFKGLPGEIYYVYKDTSGSGWKWNVTEGKNGLTKIIWVVEQLIPVMEATDKWGRWRDPLLGERHWKRFRDALRTKVANG